MASFFWLSKCNRNAAEPPWSGKVGCSTECAIYSYLLILLYCCLLLVSVHVDPNEKRCSTIKEVLVSPNHPVVVFCIWIAFIDDRKPQKTRLFKCTDTFFKCLFKLLENNFLWTNRWKIRWKMHWKIMTTPRCQVYTPVLAVGERVVLKKRRLGHKSADVQMCGCFCMHLFFLVLVAYVCCYAPISKAFSFYLAYFLDIFRIHSCLSSLCLLFAGRVLSGLLWLYSRWARSLSSTSSDSAWSPRKLRSQTKCQIAEYQTVTDSKSSSLNGFRLCHRPIALLFLRGRSKKATDLKNS